MITIATDGSCIGNPGPGAYGLVAKVNGSLIERAIPHSATTVGEMEVRGLLEALLLCVNNMTSWDEDVLIQCDAQYVVNGYNDWMAGWKSKGWRKKGGLAHAQLWEQIDEAKSLLGSKVRVEWVRAHQDNGSLNDRVDAIANACARSQRALNGPALQDGLKDLVRAGQTPAAAANAPVKSSAAELIALLKEARDMLDHLASPNDMEAQKLSDRISDAIYG